MDVRPTPARWRCTCEEGLHGGALSQLDRRLPGVGGQGGVGAVVQEQPDDREVVAGDRVVQGPGERTKGRAQLMWKQV